MGNGYIGILSGHYNYLGYGFIHYFYSSLGQTFLISVFVKYLTVNAGMDNDSFNELYGIATICSAFTLSFVGGLIDKFKVRYFSIVNALVLASFCFLISYTYNPIILFLGILGIRLTGQGLMPLVGSTSMARYFEKQRGKALSLSTMGLSLSETVMPAIAVGLIALFGWGWSWRILGLSIVFIFIPIVYFSVNIRDQFQGGKNHNDEEKTKLQTGKSRKDVLKDPAFYFLLPSVAFIPFFITGLFINHHLFENIKGWSMEWIAACFIGYGICKVLTSFLAGPVIDKFSAKKVFPFHMLPFALGMVFLMLGEHKLNALIYLCLAGMSTSLMSVSSTAMWTEIYGYKHLGAIKSMVITVVVFASALGPKVLGIFLVDLQSWQVVPAGGIIFMIVFSLMANFTLNMKWKMQFLRSFKKFKSLF